jgi:hypothetical protein
VEVVKKLFDERHGPVPGALVKPALIKRAGEEGALFDEHSLNVHSFIEFVESVPEVSLQRRPGSDFLVVPTGSEGLLPAFASPARNIRRDIWKAFLEFPKEGTERIYDVARDQVLYLRAGNEQQGVRISPVSRETQLQWRNEFAAEQPEPARSVLMEALRGNTGQLTNFSRVLRDNPSVAHSWNRVLQKRIGDLVEHWAEQNGVPATRWNTEEQLATATLNSVQATGQRAELYSLLDRVPIDDLMQIQVPLAWVLKVVKPS